MTELKDSFSSTGAKFFWHQEAMQKLRNGKGQPIVTHVMATDLCAHRCSFCSVQKRNGDALPLADITAYLDILLRFDLRAVILSGGGNPILYKCPKTGANFNQLVDAIHSRGLEIGCISDGMPLKAYENGRMSWATVNPATLDKLTWLRISMAGLDHDEDKVFVPDINPELTTLGFSYVAHDSFCEPADPYHGKVSTPADLITIGLARDSLPAPSFFRDRIPKLTEQIRHYVEEYKPAYVRTTPNCLEPDLIPERIELLQKMANEINPAIVFAQNKPPQAPHACFIGFLHPVLNCDGFCYPCDGVTLSVAEVGYRNGHPEHKFDSPWRICHWSEIASIYEKPIESLIKHPDEICRGCVWHKQNAMLEGVINGTIQAEPPLTMPLHANFV